MPMYKSMFTAALLLGLLAGCSKDPAKQRSQFEASAKQYMEQEKYNEAIIEYRNALKLMPTSSDLQTQLAEAYLKNGQLREAFAAYNKAAELDPSNRTAQLSIAKIYLIAGKPDDAIQLATAQRIKHPDDVDFGIVLASAFAAKRDLSEAIKIMDELLAKDPNAVSVLMHKGMFLVGQNKLEDAHTYFQRALAVDPKNVDAHNAIATYWLQKKDSTKAEEQYKKSIAENPENVASRMAYVQFLMQSGRGAEAEALIKQAVTLQRNSPSARMGLASYYVTLGRTPEAKQIWESLAKDHPDFLPARFEMAELALQQKKLDEAEKIVSSIRRDKPKDPGALALNARILLAQGRSAEAIQDLEAAQKSDNSIPVIHFLLGAAYQQAGNIDRAQSSYEESLNADPGFARARLALAQIMLSRGQFEAALNHADHILEKNPNQPDALMIRGNAFLGQRRLDKAQTSYTQVAQTLPTADVPWVRLGQIAMVQNQAVVAEKDFRKALELNPKQYEAVEGLTGLLVAKKDFARAESFVQQRIATDNSAPLYLTLAKVFRAANRPQNAEAALMKAVQIDPRNTTALSTLGSMYLEQKSIDKALNQFDTALKLEPNNIGLLTISGMLNQQIGKNDQAKQFYERALSIEPNAGLAANNLAFLLVTEGKDLDRALEFARRARSSMPQEPAAADTLAWVYYKRNLNDSAFPLLEEAVKARPENATYRFHLAAVLTGQGKKDQAKVEMNKALKLNSALRNDEDVKRVLSELAL
jgi:tetratricopeptide (TPR) repeat protein